jgi:hypothetical protein
MSVVSTAQHYAGLDCLSDKNRLLKAAPDCLLDKSTLLGRKCPCVCLAMSSREYDRWMRLVDGGRLLTETLGRHSVAGRTGRGTKPPPQFGQTL